MRYAIILVLLMGCADEEAAFEAMGADGCACSDGLGGEPGPEGKQGPPGVVTKALLYERVQAATAGESEQVDVYAFCELEEDAVLHGSCVSLNGGNNFEITVDEPWAPTDPSQLSGWRCRVVNASGVAQVFEARATCVAAP